MKYKRYVFHHLLKKKQFRLRKKNLDEASRKHNRKVSLIQNLLLSVYFAFLTVFVVLIIWLNKIIENKVGLIFTNIGLILAALVVPIVIVGLISLKVPEKYSRYFRGSLTSENREELARPLIKHYKVSDTYIVTKCYKSNDSVFSKMDVIIFLYNGKIRIVIDFKHTIRDGGCYEFGRDDMEITYVEEDGITMAYLKTDDVEFYLGKLAKPFIRKCFE